MPIDIWEEFDFQMREEFTIMRLVTRKNLWWFGDEGAVWLKHCWWICLLFFAAATASAVEVQDVRWGYDGLVVPGRFNVLSVLVANPSDVPFDGTVNFYKSRGLADRAGAVYRISCFLSPQATRWLQFYVYIDNQYDQWRLDWGRGPDDHRDLPAPTLGPPARVLLTDPETTLSTSSSFKQFPEDLFPTTVAATSGLESLLLDHAPRWEQAKREAFLNWLRAGGTVHLLRGADGRFPVFSDELDVLNFSRKRLNIGAGTAVRNEATAGTIRTKDISDDGLPMRDFKTDESGPMDQTADSFFNVLSRLSQRRYNWGLIYLLAIVYAILAGPGNLQAGRKLADYRLRIALLLVTIAGFAWLFDLVGRRGQGEVSVIHSLSYARSIDADNYDVMQWVNVFAARGAKYTITHAAPHNLYASGQDYESVNGVIESGKDGRFEVDIPMFSRRAFLHEAEMKGPRISIKVVRWEGAETLNELVLNVGPDFTKQILEAWVIQGGRIRAMNLTKDGLTLGDADGQSLQAFASIARGSLIGRGAYQPVTAVTNVEGEFRTLVKSLITWSLGPVDLNKLSEADPAANGKVQLFLFARSPAGFRITTPGLGDETGYVLYHFELYKPATAEKHE